MLTTPFIRHNLPQAVRPDGETVAIAATGKIKGTRGWATVATPAGPSTVVRPTRASVRPPMTKPATTRLGVEASGVVLIVVALERVGFQRYRRRGPIGRSDRQPRADANC